MTAKTKPGRYKSRVAALLLSALLAACSVNPATGERSFTGLMSPQQELQVGREQHPQILAKFGGDYDDVSIAAYVDRIGQSLARQSDLPDLAFTFTLLDSDVVNAFALPGGYVYVSRGLLALATSEAELAGVLAHEIGHVTARHSAQRYSQSVVAGLGSAILGAVVGGELGQLAQYGASAYLQSYSRSQEFEADQLGVRYLARAGYDTAAMASFLAKLQAQSELEARVSGQPDPAARYNIMSTHPRTADRVQAAAASANAAPVANPRRGVSDYLNTIDGLAYQGSRAQGFVRDNRFIHPGIGFQFEVPEGFKIRNDPSRVVARADNGAVIIFDTPDKAFSGTMTSYLRDEWATELDLTELQTLDINGFAAATATAVISNSNGTVDVRPLAIRFSDSQIFRFVFLTPQDHTAELSEPLRRTTFSFRRLNAQEQKTLKPLAIRVTTVGSGDNVAKLAQRMTLQDLQEDWFRVINGLAPGAQPQSGALVKIVSD
ncbi:MAG: M48 family metalloprotease [Alphaproteobacteria bacterium]